MTTMLNKKAIFFECHKCGDYFGAYEFSISELKEEPRCLLCSGRLVRIPVNVLGRKGNISSPLDEKGVVDFWNTMIFGE